MTVAAYDVHAAILAHLQAELGNVHDGQVVDPTLDARGRIQPYWVLWFAPGTDPDQPLTGAVDALHRLQLTAAGMDVPRTLWAVDAATDALQDRRIVTTGPDPVDVTVRWLPGYTAPEARIDLDVAPTRWFVPLLFNAHATTALTAP